MKDLHAYCIMAHGNWEQLQMLVDMLDDERNDIYLHIDKKSLTSYNNWGGVLCHFSHLVITDSVDVRWGHYSLLVAEMTLFRHVVDSGNNYNRVHLISGADLPIKSQDYIHAFFLQNTKEYLSFNSKDENANRLKIRLRYYHLFGRWRKTVKGANLLRRLLLILQGPFVNRLKNCPLNFEKGSEWCSLTLRATQFLCDNIDQYKYIFKYTNCCDEEYKQMILASEPSFQFSEPNEGCLRYVFFEQHQPSPRTLQMDDYCKIKASNCLFARKFDIHVDKEIVSRIIAEYA